MNTLSISIHDEHNLGDRVCNPCDYFEGLKATPRWNAWDGDWAYSPSSLIFGGGGLLHGELESRIRMVPRRKERKLIAWGLGHNRHGTATTDYRDTLNGFDLVGVRDFRAAEQWRFDYVPCASCMSSEFDCVPISPEWIQPFVIFQHHEIPVLLKKAWPFRILSNDNNNLGMTLCHLGSGATVITNTYHGAYWALLLGRKVLIYKPFSSRFHDFKYQPPFVDENNWKDVEPLAAPAGYLEECRELNRKFHAKVKDALGIHIDRTDGGNLLDRIDGVAAASCGNEGDSSGTRIDSPELPLAQSEARSVPERPLIGGEHDARGDQQTKELNRDSGVIP